MSTIELSATPAGSERNDAEGVTHHQPADGCEGHGERCSGFAELEADTRQRVPREAHIGSHAVVEPDRAPVVGPR